MHTCLSMHTYWLRTTSTVSIEHMHLHVSQRTCCDKWVDGRFFSWLACAAASAAAAAFFESSAAAAAATAAAVAFLASSCVMDRTNERHTRDVSNSGNDCGRSGNLQDLVP